MSKTVTMMQFRSEPGEHVRSVQRGGETLVITKSGRPAAKLCPVEDVTVIERDGTIRGSPPLTFREPVTADGTY